MISRRDFILGGAAALAGSILPAPTWAGETLDTKKTYRIALTVDDGWSCVADIFALARSQRLPLTSFMIGDAILKPAIRKYWVQAMQDEFHEWGCHTQTHPDCRKVSATKFDQELNRFWESFDEVFGKEMRHKVTHFRYPYGAIPSGELRYDQMHALRQRGWRHIGWSQDMTHDEPRAAEDAIVLMHFNKLGLTSLQKWLDLRETHNIEFVPLSDILRRRQERERQKELAKKAAAEQRPESANKESAPTAAAQPAPQVDAPPPPKIEPQAPTQIAPPKPAPAVDPALVAIEQKKLAPVRPAFMDKGRPELPKRRSLEGEHPLWKEAWRFPWWK